MVPEFYPSALGRMLAAAGRPDEAAYWLRRGRPEEGDYASGQVELARIEAE